jgi:hypothetical protein
MLVEAGWVIAKWGAAYDLLLDPVEEKDLAGDPDFSEVLDDMRGGLTPDGGADDPIASARSPRHPDRDQRSRQPHPMNR